MDDAATLHYRVPEGQDRVTVMTALQQEGFDVTPDETDHQLVHVECATGDRERVRDAIGSVRTTAIDHGVPTDPTPIRFADES